VWEFEMAKCRYGRILNGKMAALDKMDNWEDLPGNIQIEITFFCWIFTKYKMNLG
jgi:hypothetical protein